jgi:hypothetical protein
MRKIRWVYPYSIIAFCANQIKTLHKIDMESYELVPWLKFKQLIYNIYDHRIEHTHEINGSTNMNYCTMQEYILIYFMDQFRDRKQCEHMMV